MLIEIVLTVILECRRIAQESASNCFRNVADLLEIDFMLVSLLVRQQDWTNRNSFMISPHDSLRPRVIKILRTYPWSCTFYDEMGKYWVSPYWFNAIIRALQVDGKGKSRIQIGIHKASEGIASYSSSRNTILLPMAFPETADNDSLVIHESVHAIQDFAKSVFTIPSEEIAAYVAERMYLVHRGVKLEDHPKEKGLYKNIDKIAFRLLRIHDLKKRIIRWDDQDVQQTRLQLQKYYGKGVREYDGI